MTDPHATRSRAAAVLKVIGDQREDLLRLTDKLIAEFLASGGQFTGSEYATQLMAAAFGGKDITKHVASLIRWLDKNSDGQ